MISYLTRNAEDPVVLKLFLNLKSTETRFQYLYMIFQPTDTTVLQAMNYDDFLKTTYWIVIRNYLYATRNKRCYKCNRGGVLSLHHLNYEHHGFEHEHLEDLVFLCRECHEENHNPIDETIKKLLAILNEKGQQIKPKGPVENPNYDPRIMMNLHDYGDIRGHTNG